MKVKGSWGCGEWVKQRRLLEDIFSGLLPAGCHCFGSSYRGSCNLLNLFIFSGGGVAISSWPLGALVQEETDKDLLQPEA